jgi:hypothetical protein
MISPMHDVEIPSYDYKQRVYAGYTGSNHSLASRPPSMWLLINLAEVSVVANIVVAPVAVVFAASLPLSRQTINRTSLRTNGTRSIVSEDDQAYEQERDDADTETDEQVRAC